MIFTFKKEELIGKNLEVQKDEKGEVVYKQYDSIALIQLFMFLDTRHCAGIKDYRIFINAKDKIYQVYLEDKQEIEFNLDETTFLKSYFENVNSRILPQNTITEFHIRTLLSLLDQIEKFNNPNNI